MIVLRKNRAQFLHSGAGKPGWLVEVDDRIGNEKNQAICEMAGSSGPCGCVQKLMRFQVFTPTCISPLVSCKDCEMGWQIEALGQGRSSDNDLRSVGPPEHALTEVSFKP